MAGRIAKYFVDERVAIGGMAEIFRAHSSSGQTVAIKKIHSSYSADPKFIQMFLDEARIITRLKHENIVQLIDFGRVDDTYFLSLEWIDGKALSEVIRTQIEQKVLFPIEVALILMLDVCDGLAFAHSREDQFGRPLQIVHRDVSPPNILITRECVAKVADFGIAAARDKVVTTQPGIIRGKFSYMSPEQSRGDPLDARSDIFSLGIVLYELLTSRRLFLRENDVETLKAVRNCEVPPISRLRPDVSGLLSTTLAKAFEHHPPKRYSTVVDFRKSLCRVLQTEFPHTSRSSVGQFLNSLYGEGKFVPSERALLLDPGDEQKTNSIFVWRSSHSILLAILASILTLIILMFR